MNPYALLPFAAFISNTVAAFYIRTRYYKNPLSKDFFRFASFIACWALTHVFMYFSNNQEVLLTFSHLAMLFSGLTGVSLFQLMLAFTKNEFWLNKTKYLYALPALSFVSSITTNLMTTGVENSYWGLWLTRGPLFPFHIGYIAIFAVAGLFFVGKKYLTETDKNLRNQSLMLFVGLLSPVIGGFFFDGIAPILKIEVLPLLIPFTTIFILVVAYSIMKFDFLKITPILAADEIMDTMSDMVIAVGSNLKINFVNKAVYKTTQFSDYNLIDQPIDKLFTDSNNSQQIFDRITTDNKIDDLETEIITQAGKQISVSINGTLVKSQSYEVSGFILVIRDVTPMKKLIADLSHKNTELEKNKSVIEKNAAELKKKVNELERFNAIVVDRELKMVALKKEIAELKGKSHKEQQSFS